MTQHVCPRCGHEDECSFGAWYDRHPVLATIGGIFSLTFMAMVFSVYPGGAWTMTGLAAAVFGIRAIGRGRQRRAALAARAEYEHAALMARTPPPPTIRRQPSAVFSPPPAKPWHVMTHWPTTPMPTARVRR